MTNYYNNQLNAPNASLFAKVNLNFKSRKKEDS